MEYRDLLFRRQFLLIPQTYECGTLNHWQHAHFGSHHLYSHPEIELSTTTVEGSQTSLALIGYIVDSGHSEKRNDEILKEISGLGCSVERLSHYLCSTSGRFVLIINNQEETLIFHDPCGLRSVYYTEYKGEVFVGSQPLIFKTVISLEKGDRFYSYMNSSYVKRELEHWVPSGCSLYENVRHLIPNHYLRFSDLEQIRYWPKKNRCRRTHQSCA